MKQIHFSRHGMLIIEDNWKENGFMKGSDDIIEETWIKVMKCRWSGVLLPFSLQNRCKVEAIYWSAIAKYWYKAM